MNQTDEYTQRICTLLKADKIRVEVLREVRELQLPQCYVAAGFVRNLVWDYLHQKKLSTPLTDIDVVYFDKSEPLVIDASSQRNKFELRLAKVLPMHNWQVRNQAVMHIRNGDPSYTSTINAMSYWPEKETAVGVKLNADERLECISAFSLESLFSGKISWNKKRSASTFFKRVEAKNWRSIWPDLILET